MSQVGKCDTCHRRAGPAGSLGFCPDSAELGNFTLWFKRFDLSNSTVWKPASQILYFGRATQPELWDILVVVVVFLMKDKAQQRCGWSACGLHLHWQGPWAESSLCSRRGGAPFPAAGRGLGAWPTCLAWTLESQRRVSVKEGSWVDTCLLWNRGGPGCCVLRRERRLRGQIPRFRRQSHYPAELSTSCFPEFSSSLNAWCLAQRVGGGFLGFLSLYPQHSFTATQFSLLIFFPVKVCNFLPAPWFHC